MSKPTVELIGTIKWIGGEDKINDKYPKRELAIDTGETQVNDLLVVGQSKDVINEIGTLGIGERVRFKIRLEGKYWEKGDKYFNNLVLTEISLITPEPLPDAIPEESFNPSDDLPF